MASNIQMLSLKLAGTASGAHLIDHWCVYNVNVIEEKY